MHRQRHGRSAHARPAPQLEAGTRQRSGLPAASAHQRACNHCWAPCSQATPWSSQPTSGRPTLAESSEAQGGQPRYAVSTHRLPRLLRCRTDARRSALQRRTLTTQRAPSGCRLAVPTSRPPPLAATGSFGLTCRTATGITGLRCGASCTFILSLQRHGRKKVGSLRSAICLLAADVYTMGGQGGGPRRAVRPPIDT